MRNFLFSVATIFTANFVFAQITLEHTFPSTEAIYPFTENDKTHYVSQTNDNKLKIYNADFSVYKTVTIPIPENFTLGFWYNNITDPYSISQHIFNLDDKLEFLVELVSRNINSIQKKLLLINEDGVVIKDFNPNPSAISYGNIFKIYHDGLQNKLLIEHRGIGNGNSGQFFYEVYSLPTNSLSIKEIQNKTRLSAFPIPTNKVLNIINPENGASKNFI